MKPNVSALLSFFLLLILMFHTPTNGQVRFKIPIAYTDSLFLGGDDPNDTTVAMTFQRINADTIWFGVHESATICRDTLNNFTTHWTLDDTGTVSEDVLPPPSPSGREMKFSQVDSRQGCFLDGSKADIRGTGLVRDSVRIKVGAENNTDVPPLPLFHREVMRWPSTLAQYFDSCRMKNLGGPAVNVDMRQQFKLTGGLFSAAVIPSHNYRITFVNAKSVPPIPAVTLLTPADAVSGVVLSPTLTWSAAAGALYYRIQVSKADPNLGQVNLIVDDSLGAGATSRPLVSLTANTVYYWRVAVFTTGGVSYFQNPAYSFTTQGSTGVGDSDHRGPEGFQLYQNYPDPFNPSTIIRYSLPEQSHVRLTVYTVLGVEVETLVDELQPQGMKSAEFRPYNLPSGTYIYRLSAGRFTDVRRMLLIR